MDEVAERIKTNFSITEEGVASLGEKCGKSEDGVWDYAELLEDVDLKDVSLEISVRDGNGPYIEISHYRASSSDGTRVFYFRVGIGLVWEEVDQIHRYLGFLLAGRRGNV